MAEASATVALSRQVERHLAAAEPPPTPEQFRKGLCSFREMAGGKAWALAEGDALQDVAVFTDRDLRVRAPAGAAVGYARVRVRRPDGRVLAHRLAHRGAELRDHARTALAALAAEDAQRALGVSLRRPELRERRAGALCLLVSLGGVPLLAMALAGLHVGLHHPDVGVWPAWLCLGGAGLTYVSQRWRHHVLHSAVAAVRREVKQAPETGLADAVERSESMRVRGDCLAALVDAAGETAAVSGADPPPQDATPEQLAAAVHAVRPEQLDVLRTGGFTHERGVLTSLPDGSVRLPLRAVVVEGPPLDFTRGRVAYPARSVWLRLADAALCLGGCPCVCAAAAAVGASVWWWRLSGGAPARKAAAKATHPAEHLAYAAVLLTAGCWAAVNAERVQRQLQQELTSVAWLSRHPLNDRRDTLTRRAVEAMLA